MATLYFSNTISQAWNDIPNWYTDAGLIIPAGRIPVSTDSVVVANCNVNGISAEDSAAGSPVTVVNATFSGANWDSDLIGIGINCTTAVFTNSICSGVGNIATLSINASSSITFNGACVIDAGVLYSPIITLNGSTRNNGGDGPSVYSGPTGYAINVNGTASLSNTNVITQFYNDPNIIIANSAVIPNLSSCFGVASITITGGGGGVSVSNVLLTELLKLPFPIVL